MFLDNLIGARVLLAAKGVLEGRTEVTISIYPLFTSVSTYNNEQVLHVQGVSHWAPANIGPYSQGVLASNQLHVSGQIGEY